MKKTIYILIFLSSFSFSYSQPDTGWKRKVSTSLLQKSADDRTVPFLIILSQQADLSYANHLNTKSEKSVYVFESLQTFANKSQKNLLEFLQLQQIPYKNLFIVNAIRAEGTVDLIKTIALRHDVRKILDDATITFPKPVQDETDDHSRSVIEWGIERINADDVWALGIRGQGVTVGGGDTGYNWRHPALINQYRGYDKLVDTVNHNYNWHDAIHVLDTHNIDSINSCGLNSKVPCDDGSHGTHTMGTMIGLDGINEIGVAPEAKWCGCRNMERGWGTPFTYIECFQWFLAPTDLNNENPDPTLSPHVINNSWGCPETEGCDFSNFEVMNQVINILRLAGIVVVVSAGNSGPECSTVSVPAAIFEGSFSVGAIRTNDTIANFSSRGPVAIDSSFRVKPNIVAPGVSVRSAILDSSYANFSGTSMAGPHVAGLVALMISANPDLAGKVELIETIIEQTAVPKTTDQNCGDTPGSVVPNNVYGYGRIDALAAVQAAIALIPVNTQDETKSSSIKVYPNPFTNQLNFVLPDSNGDAQIEIFDSNGRLMLYKKFIAENNSLLHIDLSHSPSGIYFYRIATDSMMNQGRAVKK